MSSALKFFANADGKIRTVSTLAPVADSPYIGGLRASAGPLPALYTTTSGIIDSYIGGIPVTTEGVVCVSSTGPFTPGPVGALASNASNKLGASVGATSDVIFQGTGLQAADQVVPVTGFDGSSFSPTEARALLNNLLAGALTVADYQQGNWMGTGTARAWINSIGIAPPLLQTTAGFQPAIVSPPSGMKCAYLPGVAANYFSTPNSVASAATADLDVKIKVAPATWIPAAAQVLCAKTDEVNQRSWKFELTATGTLILSTSSDGSAMTAKVTSAATGFSDGTMKWLRATFLANNGAAGNVGTIYTSDDGLVWKILARTVNAGATAIFAGTALMTVGSIHAGTIPSAGIFCKMTMSKIIDGPPSVDWDPSYFAITEVSGATAASPITGETWTMFNTAIAVPAQTFYTPSSTTQLGFDGTDDLMVTGAFTLAQPETIYLVATTVATVNADFILDGFNASPSMAIQQIAPNGVRLNAGSATAADAGVADGTPYVLTAIFNGASSSIQFNGAAATTGLNVGAGNGGGLTLGANQAGAGSVNIRVKELIIRANVDGAATTFNIQTLLKAIHGTP